MALIAWSYIRPVLKRTTDRRESLTFHTAPNRGAKLVPLLENSRDVATGAFGLASGVPYRS